MRLRADKKGFRLFQPLGYTVLHFPPRSPPHLSTSPSTADASTQPHIPPSPATLQHCCSRPNSQHRAPSTLGFSLLFFSFPIPFLFLSHSFPLPTPSSSYPLPLSFLFPSFPFPLPPSFPLLSPFPFLPLFLSPSFPFPLLSPSFPTPFLYPFVFFSLSHSFPLPIPFTFLFLFLSHSRSTPTPFYSPPVSSQCVPQPPEHPLTTTETSPDTSSSAGYRSTGEGGQTTSNRAFSVGLGQTMGFPPGTWEQELQPNLCRQLWAHCSDPAHMPQLFPASPTHTDTQHVAAQSEQI